MKTQVYTLNSVPEVNRLLSALKALWREAMANKKPLVIKLSDTKEEYTSAQRRLYWMWIHQYAKHFGYDEDDAHLQIKKRFLIKIYYRDDKDFAEMCDAVAKLEKSEPDQWRVIRQHVIKSTSITNAERLQMAEFLDKFFHHAEEEGCLLKTPEDLKFAASYEAQQGRWEN